MQPHKWDKLFGWDNFNHPSSGHICTMKTRRLLKQFTFCTGQCSTWHLHAFTTCSFLVRTIVEHSSLHTCLMFLVWCCHCILQRLCHSKPLFLSSLHASGLHWRSAASLHWIIHSWWKLWSNINIFVSMLKRACDACVINCVWSTWCQRVVNFSKNQAQGNTTPTTPVLRIEKGSYLHQLPSCINVIGKGRVYSNSSLWSKFILLESKFIQHNVQHLLCSII